jgi:predicted nucleic acid-binding protein
LRICCGRTVPPATSTTDAHLAALAFKHGGVVLSSDADFSRFAGLAVINPLA